MKKLIFFVLILSATASFGQSKDELEIRRLENHWTQLLDKSDTTALLKLWTKGKCSGTLFLIKSALIKNY